MSTVNTAALADERARRGVPVYFRDPDGARIEPISDPLGEMYRHEVL